MKNIDVKNYIQNLENALKQEEPLELIPNLAKRIFLTWRERKKIFICGNGGSAANANHIANDFIFGARIKNKGFNIESLSSNEAVITCIANDTGYENIYAYQLNAKACKDDILIVLSGSGNSKNILEAIDSAKKIGMETFAILGFNGGQCKKIVDNAIHFNVNDMQISEDLQLIVFHMCMQWIASQND